MERQLWKAIVAVLATIDKPRASTACRYSDEVIVKVWYWSVIHDRPMSWACESRNWPLDLRRWPRPSYSRLTRRLRTPSVRALLFALEQRVMAPRNLELFWMIDGKPLPISGCSKDSQAGYGRAAGGKAKGYKLHAIIGSHGAVATWRIAPMNKDERVMAGRMLKAAPVQGYVVADSNYDSNKLHEVCDARGNLQLVTRRRYGSGHGTGHRTQTPGRRRSIELLENPNPSFGEKLLAQRSDIERRFGNLTNWGGGLPAWVRSHRRVHRWVQAKLVLTALKQNSQSTTCAA
jgi:Transposase DDE domain